MTPRYTMYDANIYDNGHSLCDTDIVDRLNEQDEDETRIKARCADLLAACETAINMDWHGIGAPHVYEQLRAAIDKATQP